MQMSGTPEVVHAAAELVDPRRGVQGAFAAVAPRATTCFGLTISNCRSKNGRQLALLGLGCRLLDPDPRRPAAGTSAC